jgi:hypothetical protein
MNTQIRDTANVWIDIPEKKIRTKEILRKATTTTKK